MVPPAASRLAALAAAAVATADATVLVVHRSAVGRTDVRVHEWAQSHPVHWLVDVAHLVVNVISPPVDIVATLLIAALVARRSGDRKVLWSALGCVALLVVSVLGLKYGINRHGPGSHPAGTDPGGYFPSGHTTSVLVCGTYVAVMLGWPLRRAVTAAAGVAALVGASLVYISGHWLSDVVGAVFVATGILAVALPVD